MIRRRFLNLGQSGFTHSMFIFVLLFIFSVVSIARFVESHAAADGPKIISGISGYCLDVYKDKSTDALVNDWKCNDSSAQVWNYSNFKIEHGSGYCLTVEADSISVGLNNCNGGPEQIWLRDASGYFNPKTQNCLTSSTNNPESHLTVASCTGLNGASQTWTPSFINNSCNGSEGTVIACNAAKQWTIWQANGANHENLLNTYTDGAAYEEWCADFVSYVYKQSGYPFTNGESDGWDENNANNIINMGFTQHQASSGYIPKAGDVAYFNYSGGHVEIVISGGHNPTFVYGNSATIDRTTGNGQMEANTITSDGNEGQIVYYLSPN